MIRKLSLPFVAVAAVLSTLAVGANNAQADYRDCPDKFVCLWGDSNYDGRFLAAPQNSDGALLFNPNVGDFMNDLTTSIWNRTDWIVCFYNDTHYQGTLLCLNPGNSSGNIGSAANDKISSFQPFPAH